MFEKLPLLVNIDIQGINIGYDTYFSLKGPNIRVVSFNWGKDLGMIQITNLLYRFPNCYKLILYGSGKEECNLDEINDQENWILPIPIVCPKISEIALVNTQILKVQIGCFYNGDCDAPSDGFRGKFAAKFPLVVLNTYSS
jgi:hypothetical protein